MTLEPTTRSPQLKAVEQFAQTPTRVFSRETVKLVNTKVADALKAISIPDSIYYSDKTNGKFDLDLKAHASLSDQEKGEICDLMNHYRYDPTLPPGELSERGFVGSPRSNAQPKLTRDKLISPPMRSDWLLVKDQGKVIAFMTVHPFDKHTPPELSNTLATAASRRPIEGNGFLRSASVVDEDYKGKNLFRLMLEALKEAYQASYSLSFVFPQNTPSIEANHAVGAEDVGAMGNGQSLFVLNFNKYIKTGETKPQKILYPFTDPSAKYPNISNPVSHTEALGTQHAIDFPLALGTKLNAVADGTVKLVIDSNPDYKDGQASSDMDPEQANSIVIEGKDGLIQEYVHIAHDSSQVKVGDTVKAGDPICKSGHNGASTEPHLHFCLLKEDSTKEAGYNSVPVRFLSAQSF